MESKKTIHTTLNKSDYNYLKKIQDTNNCNLNEAISMIIIDNKKNELKIKNGILDAVVNEVLARYLQLNRNEEQK